ncbi:MAG: FumA C-terminus/TtdB family hydratase beta subunit [Pseudomonadota bacterium]|nr:FumA C-terminus/TtdB family hydratase beta subunit [Pseudomonadota bacterium]
MNFLSDIFKFNDKNISYYKVCDSNLEKIFIKNRKYLFVNQKILEKLAEIAFYEISHYLRSSHLKKLKNIITDDQASDNDKYVALTLLKNANIAAGGILPMCQDTGTAIIIGKKGNQILSNGLDNQSLSKGIYKCFKNNNLRYSQMSAKSMYHELNTKNNLPAQIEILNEGEKQEYKFYFIAKGGGSANKTFFFQATPSLLKSKNLEDYLIEKIVSIGTAACPPYHLAIIIGGLSAEMNLKTLKLASSHFLDTLPKTGNTKGLAFRDLKMESSLYKKTINLKIGAQFGGKYFCHDVRVIRLPRHGASLPISIGVSCGADRQAIGKINENGVYLEKLEKNPAKFLPKIKQNLLSKKEVIIDLDKPIKETLEILSKLKIKTRVLLSGTMIVARDIAHSKLKSRLDKGKKLPSYFMQHPIYYAGPAKTPKGYNTGSFGPTTAGRMDTYVEQFQSHGASLIMLAKGNRSSVVKESCKKYSGFYLGSIGGPGAELAYNNIKEVKCLAFPELGMEAIWKIKVINFPAFIIIDNKGNDFYSDLVS